MRSQGFSAWKLLWFAGRIEELKAAEWGNRLGDPGLAGLIRVAGRESSAMSFGLCRLVFAARETEAMREPYAGLPFMLGQTEATDWPLMPICLHQGVPFLIVKGRLVGGQPEDGADYLAYCLKFCRREPQSIRKPGEELRSIAQDFVRHGPWRRPLMDDEESFILAQTEEPPENEMWRW